MSEKRCWEFHKCGVEQKCPAYPDQGRECWKVTGTLCRGQVQGTAEQKKLDCVTLCQFMEGVLGGKV